jgi:peptide/nickel transport system permease protein
MSAANQPLDALQAPAAGADAGPGRRENYVVIRKLLESRNGRIGLFITLVVLVLALAGPSIAPFDPIEQNMAAELTAPCWQHWFGTDEFGRDILSRMLHGTRVALQVGLIADGIALVIGVLLGLVAGYFRGKVDTLIMRFMDVLLAFPYLLLAMMIVAILGPGLRNAMIAIGFVYIPQYTRLVRGSVLATRELVFVTAARISGCSDWRIMTRHILRNCYSPIIVQATLTFGSAIVETAGLGFLGLGAQPPQPEWGAMLSTGRNFILQAPWICTFPGLGILFTVIGFNLLGDGLRDALDPKS